MEKELGKWFMDIAKYLLTAVVVGALVNDMENTRWLVYVGGICATLTCLTLGIMLLRSQPQQVAKQKEKK